MSSSILGSRLKNNKNKAFFPLRLNGQFQIDTLPVLLKQAQKALALRDIDPSDLLTS